MKLTEEQKNEVKRLFKDHPDLKYLTATIFKNEKLDGRSKEGKAIRQFLIDEGLEYKTSEIPKVEAVELTEENKKFLLSDQVGIGCKPIELTRILFEDKDVKPLGIENRTVIEFLKEHRPEILNEDEIAVTEKWFPPTQMTAAIKRVNRWAGKELHHERLNTKDKKSCEQLLIYFKSKRFSTFINSYRNLADRDLFESEFVRSVWDKPDLTIDELNLYITVCANYVRQKHIQRRLDILNNKLDEMDDAGEDVTMRFNELIKNTSEELNACEKRIEQLIQKLNGDRAKRIDAQGKNSVSIIALVEAFQTHEERERFVKMAEMENTLAEQEVDRLESFDEIKARILGITKRELI